MDDLKDALEKIGQSATVTEGDIRNLAYSIQSEDTPYQRAILFALNDSGRHIYAGTANPEKVTKRRKANKVARAQRKINTKGNNK